MKVFEKCLAIITAMAVVLIAGCGSSTREAPAGAGVGVQTVGFLTCYNCHSDSQNPAGLRKPFGDITNEGWLQSRHANFNSSPSYPLSSAVCKTCHNELGDGDLISAYYDRTGDSTFGISNRNLVGCESCHGGGGNHFGLGPLENDFSVMSDFGVCTKCHSLTTNTLHPGSELNIADTHLDNALTNDIEGYILNPNAKHSDLQGNTNSGTCIDCHEPHFADLEINRAWANSAHAGFIGLNNIVNASTAEPFAGRDFKATSACHRCHTATGFRNRANNQDGYNPANNVFVATGAQKELIYCWACHSNNIGGIRVITNAGSPGVIFPSGAVANIDVASNICAMCHQGRTAGGPVTLSGTVANAIAKPGTDTFINIHYFAAAASFLGNEVNGGYEYVAGNYVGRNTFPGHTTVDKTTCAGCHLRRNESAKADHHFVPELNDCKVCHTGITAFADIRPSGLPDYDGDGDSSEGLRYEVETLEEALIANIMSYASTTLSNAIVYNGTSYPYFFKDTNGNGIHDPGETTSYTFGAGGDTKLLPAAYNYQVSKKEPCGYIHNHRYIIQLLIDSIADLGGSIVGYTRPSP